MVTELRGKPVADYLMEEIARDVARLNDIGVLPTLAILRVGERKDDLSYERAAEKRCASVGAAVKRIALPSDCSQGELMDAIAAINTDDSIHGCLLLRPLPSSLDEEAAAAALDVKKDVDGITPLSLFSIFSDQKIGFAPCTAEACLRILDHYSISIDGKDAVVLGRSLVIGRPVAALLTNRNATVTLCHSHTQNVADICRRADILIAAVGRSGVITEECVNSDQAVIDVGMNWDETAEKFVGDVVFDEVAPHVFAITPVPGGVGAVTTAVLVRHVVTAAEKSVAKA